MNVLKGTRVLVTRPEHQAENLSRLIEEHGGIAIRFPTLDIIASDAVNEIQKILRNLNNYQWVVFISVNAVNFALKANGGKIDKLDPVRFAAIGQATTQALQTAGLTIDLAPEQGYTSEALLAMPPLQQVKGQKVLIIRGQGGREELATELRSRGAKVHYLDVYQRAVPRKNGLHLDLMLAHDKIDVITITSGEALQNLQVMLDAENYKRLFALPLVVVSDRIRQIAVNMGFKRITVSSSPSDAEILKAVIIYVTEGE
jgi:uroporphyrinogen-III synthase